MFHLKHLILVVFLFLAVTQLVVWLSPLDYTSVYASTTHFVLLIGFANWYFFLVFRKTKHHRGFAIKTSIFTTILLAISFAYIVVAPDKQLLETTPIPGTNKVISSKFYTLFMMGNPRVDLSVDRSFFSGNLVWRTNVSTRNGMGDYLEESTEFDIPKKFLQKEGVFLLPEEGYLFDYYENKVYKLEKRSYKKRQ